jgi:hypothetical protein
VLQRSTVDGAEASGGEVVSRTVKDMRDGRRELRRKAVRERRRRMLSVAVEQLSFQFADDWNGRRVQPGTELDRMEVLA